jgi:hypothetical protein
MTPEDLVELEQVRALKRRSCRLFDTKRFAELGEPSVDDGTASDGGGAITLSGRAGIVAFLDRAMGSERILTRHLVSHPEIALTWPDPSTGSRAPQDVAIHEEHGVAIGGAFYDDRYVRTARARQRAGGPRPAARA